MTKSSLIQNAKTIQLRLLDKIHNKLKSKKPVFLQLARITIIGLNQNKYNDFLKHFYSPLKI